MISLPRSRRTSSETDPAEGMSRRLPFKFVFGDDQVLFMLKADDDVLPLLGGLEKRSLDTPTCVEVKQSPLGGLGLFTTKDCSPGDLLLSERPMVSIQ
jgi:hypothetical protein